MHLVVESKTEILSGVEKLAKFTLSMLVKCSAEVYLARTDLLHTNLAHFASVETFKKSC